MADISINKFRTAITRGGATPATPGFAETEGQDPVNPSGANSNHNPVTIGSPVNGLFITTGQELTIGLASSGVTGALSGTDWNTFNGKLNLTSPITGYVIGANTALLATDTILGAFGKIQGQIGARVSGTIASGQVAFGTGVNTVGGSNNLFWDNGNQRLGIGGNPSLSDLRIVKTTNITLQISSNSNVLDIIQTTTGNSAIVNRASGNFTIFNNTIESVIIDNTGKFTTKGTTRLANTTLHDFTNFSSYLNFQSTGSSIQLFLNRSGQTERTGIGADSSYRIRLWNEALGNGIFSILRTSDFAGVFTDSPTNTLDVNGTTRIRTISNLGSTATRFLVASATGVISERTGAELVSDIGLVTIENAQTINGLKTFAGGIIVNSVVGQNEIMRLGEKTGKQRFTSFQNGNNVQWRVNIQGNDTTRDVSSDPSYALALDSRASGIGFSLFRWPPTSGTFQEIMRLNQSVFRLTSASDIQMFEVSMVNGSLTLRDSANLSLGTATGTKIGTATNQKLAFYNSTPIVQPTTGVAAATLVSNAGTTLTSTDTFDGYTLQQVVKALRNTGLLA